MAIPLLAAGVSLLPSLFRTITGSSQRNRAAKINPVNPGYQINQAVVDNASNLTNRANNYFIPNYGGVVNDIYSSGATAFNRGIQGATNSGDVLDLATRIAYGQNAAMNNLAAQNAQGAETAYLQGLDAQAAAGRELQQKNAWDREQYMQQLREKAALEQAGTENIYGGLDSAASLGANVLMSGSGQAPNTNSVSATPFPSIFSSSPNTQVNDYYKQLLGNWNMGLNRPTVNYQRTF